LHAKFHLQVVIVNLLVFELIEKILFRQNHFEGRLEYLAKDIREEVTQLRVSHSRRMDGIVEELHFTQKALMATKNDLTSEIKSLRGELKSDMTTMEKRLSDKIDGNSKCAENHENRIAVLESTAHTHAA